MSVSINVYIYWFYTHAHTHAQTHWEDENQIAFKSPFICLIRAFLACNVISSLDKMEPLSAGG